MERLTYWHDKEHAVLDMDAKNVRYATEKLAKYEDAEEQGLLLRLPCKPGDKIYYIVVGGRKNIIKNAKVIKIVIRDNIEIHCEHTILSPRQVFPTWEKADQALKDMESEG